MWHRPHHAPAGSSRQAFVIARVGRHFRIEQRFGNRVDGGEQRAIGNVAGAVELRVGTGKVEMQLAAADGERQLDFGDTGFVIAVEKIFGLEASGRQLIDLRAEALLGEIEIGCDLACVSATPYRSKRRRRARPYDVRRELCIRSPTRSSGVREFEQQ